MYLQSQILEYSGPSHTTKTAFINATNVSLKATEYPDDVFEKGNETKKKAEDELFFSIYVAGDICYQLN